MRVLSPSLPHEELAHHAQEFAASRLKRDVEASAEDDGHQECAGAASAPAAATQTTVNRAEDADNGLDDGVGRSHVGAIF